MFGQHSVFDMVCVNRDGSYCRGMFMQLAPPRHVVAVNDARVKCPFPRPRGANATTAVEMSRTDINPILAYQSYVVDRIKTMLG